jgi:hypothetical protein
VILKMACGVCIPYEGKFKDWRPARLAQTIKYSTPAVEYPALPLQGENIDFDRRVAQDIPRWIAGCTCSGWLGFDH